VEVTGQHGFHDGKTGINYGSSNTTPKAAITAMSDTDATAHELTDPELISRVREGDVGAYGTLFARHVDAATRLARLLVGAPDADDLVSEAFVKVLNVLLAGGGPDVAFRAYLLTAVRRLHIDKVRGQQKLTTTGDMTPFDPGVPFTDPAVAGFEGGAAAKAFASLPERWQMVLWHLEVENQKPADIAVLLGMSANSVSALAYRAREGLRQAFLNMHAGDLVSEACRDTNDLMGGYVRHGLSRRDTAKVEDHLDHCRRCTAVYLELAEVNSSLAGLLGPVLLGGAAAAYLGGGAAVGAGAGAGAAAVVGRIRDLAMANLPATAAATVTAVGVATIAGVAIGNRGTNEAPAAAEPPHVVGLAPSSTPSPSDQSSAGARKGSPTPHTLTATTAATEQALANAVTTTSTTSTATTGTETTGTGTTGGGTEGDNGPGPTQSSGGDKPDPTNPSDPTSPSEPSPTEPTPSEPEPTEPTPTPTPTEPPPRSADIGVSASVYYDRAGHLHATVTVSGIPPGEQVQLHASSSTGNLHSHNGVQCHRSGNTYDCMVSLADTSLLFGTHSMSRPTLTFTVSGPTGWKDPSSGNNSVSVTGHREGDSG
jgi:RNA polymerase sigma factor (sigma-70 family)